MKLDKIILINWGTVHQGEYELSGRTIFTGPTGAGKSSCLDAIQTVMTAAYHHLYNYNPSQEETRQGARDGKTKRTLWSYIVGAEDTLFARPDGANGYIGAVFRPSEGEEAKPFTALVAVAARVDRTGNLRNAIEERLALLIIDDAMLAADDLYITMDDDLYETIPVEKIDNHLKSKYAGVINFGNAKREYLCQLYGRFRGRRTVPFEEAEDAARAWVSAIAQRDIGSVDELVKTQILEYDPHNLTKQIGQISDLMRQIHGLTKEGERLKVNVERLESLEQRVGNSMRLYESSLSHKLLLSMREKMDDEAAIEASDKTSAVLMQEMKTKEAERERLEESRIGKNKALVNISARLMGIPEAALKNTLEDRIKNARKDVATALTYLSASLHLSQRLEATAKRLGGVHFQFPRKELEAAIGNMSAELVRIGQAPVDDLAREATTLGDKSPEDLRLYAKAIEPLAGRFDALHEVVTGSGGVLAELLEYEYGLRGSRKDALQKRNDLATEKANMAAGAASYPNEFRHAKEQLEYEFPMMRVQVLCDLIEPVGIAWQPAIEAYMAKARFNFIVRGEDEQEATRFLKKQGLKAKIIQGDYCRERARPHLVPQDSIIYELKTDHPVAQAYLIEQYGSVVKVDSLEVLKRTPRGVMKDGTASASRTMFACDPVQPLFGEEAKRQALEDIIRRHGEATEDYDAIDAEHRQAKVLNDEMRGLQRPDFSAVSDLLLAASIIEDSLHAISKLDLKSVNKLEEEREVLAKEIQILDGQVSAAVSSWTTLRDKWNDQQDLAQRLEKGLDARRRQIDADKTELHKLCIENAGLSFEQLESDVLTWLDDPGMTVERIRSEIQSRAQNAYAAYALVATEVAGYNLSARLEESLQVSLSEPSRNADFTPVYIVLTALDMQVRRQLELQRGIGMWQNADQLKQANASFQEVFMGQFCYGIKNAVDVGLKGLTILNGHLSKLKFGTDRFLIDWSQWVPAFKDYYDYFEEVHALSERLEKGDLFGENTLSDKSKAVHEKLSRLLLDDDHGKAMEELRRITDHRNYRRYEIWKKSDSGAEVALSTWGTGSGGQLETPAYIIKSAIVAAKLKTFDKGPSLKLLVNDESFGKIDEKRTNDVMRFITDSLGMQFICAIPTKNAGTLKPLFTKEYAFTRAAVPANGELNFVLEADMRDLRPDQLRSLWDARKQEAREQARLNFEASERAVAT